MKNFKLTIKKEYLLYLFFSILLAHVVANRGNTRDTIIYYSVFKNIDVFDLLNPIKFYVATGMEIGFGWYCYLVSFISNSHVVLFFIFSLLIFWLIYKIANHFPIHSIWVFLLYISSGYFVLQQFMQIRQALATPMALYAIILLLKHNRLSLKFFIVSLLATSFHQIAFPLVLFGVVFWYFLNRNTMSLHKFKIFSILTLIIFIILSKFFLVNLLLQVSDRVLVYSESSEYAQNLSLFRLPNIKAFCTFLLLLFLMNKQMYKNHFFLVFYLFFTLGLAFRIGFIDFAILSGRFATTFSFSEIFILPFAFFRFKTFGIYFIWLFIIMQAIATYGYQVPENFYIDYQTPLIQDL